MSSRYTPGKAERIYMATLTDSEEAAVKTLTERAALFYGVDPKQVGVTLTSAEQYESEESYTFGGSQPVSSETRFSVEGFGYILQDRWGN